MLPVKLYMYVYLLISLEYGNIGVEEHNEFAYLYAS